MMNIADRIQSLRKQKGMSQIELADAIGVSRQAVSKWESEQAIPDLDKIIAMSEIFGTTTDYLLKGIEPVEGDPDAAGAPKPKMSKEDSIALAEKLTHEYKALEKLRTQISDNETILKRPVDGSYAQHAAFKFFWPFFIYAVLAYILSDEFVQITPAEKNELREIVTVNGRSFSDPILDENGNENMDASRRVEFKFRLHDETMIEQMRELLKSFE